MSMGHTYKFFGFYISYTILTLPLSIFHLSSMLLILCTLPPWWGNAGHCTVMLYVGEGPRGSNGACSTLCQILVTPFATHN